MKKKLLTILTLLSVHHFYAQEQDSIDLDGEFIESVVLEGYRDKSEYVSKMPLKNIENPQVYSTVSENLLKQQIITNYDDAMKNVPGVQQLWQSTGRGVSNGAYYSVRGFSVQPTMLNGLPGLTSGYPDPANVERIEVIKGPSGTLFGSQITSYGGLINVITKKPKKDFEGELSYTLGENTLNRVTADINTPIDKQGKLTSRFVGAFHTEDSYQDYGFNRSYLFAPSFSYKPSDRLSFLVQAQFTDSEITNPTMLFLDRANPLTVDNINDFQYNPYHSYTSDDLTLENPTFNIQTQANYKIADNWNSQTVFQVGESRSKGIYSYLYEGTTTLNNVLTQQSFPTLSQGSMFMRLFSDQNITNTTFDIQQNFTGNFKVGNMKNKLLVGLDYYHNKQRDKSSNYISNGAIYFGNDDANYVNQVLNLFVQNFSPDQYPISGANGNLTKEGAEQLLQTTTYNDNEVKNKVYSAYVSDVLDVTSRLALSAGLRLDYFDSQESGADQTTLSPRFGAVYQVIPKKLSLFGNYMNGFTNTTPRSVADTAGNNVSIKEFDPEQANQWEFGIKTSLIDNKMVSSLSFYDIKVTDRIMADPNNPNNFIQGGEVRSKGVELDVRANPFAGLDMIVGYSYNDSKVEKTDNQEILGTRPLEAGADHLFNFWVNYTMQDYSFLKGLGFGIGGNYTSEMAIINYASTGVFNVPAEFILNAAVSYEFSKFKINAKVDNLTDREYYRGWTTINPQMPRRFLGSITYKF